MTERPWPTDPRGATPETEWRIALSETAPAPLDLPGGYERLVVVAAHPDDETLGAGGLIHTASALGLRVDVVVASAGEASHPDSPTHTPQQLAGIRRAEAVAAVAALAPPAGVVQLDHPDGRIADRERDLVAELVRLIGTDGAVTLVAAPWRDDRHPDHEAAGRAAATACVRTDAHLLEYPVWLWHWGHPVDAPWSRLCVLALPDAARRAKRAAVRAYPSQVGPLSHRPGDETLLPEPILQRFDREAEVFVRAEPEPDVELDRLHADADDPWNTATSDYESAKRDATCAALPRERYGRVLDVGCSIGVLTEQLAERADHVVAVDASASALRTATRRVRSPNVDFRLLHVPSQWPDGTFDLIVVSEIGYFLSPAQLSGLVAAVLDSLAPDSTVVLCHWRHDIDGWPLDAAAVHAAFDAAMSDRFARVASNPTDDYLLDVYTNGTA